MGKKKPPTWAIIVYIFLGIYFIYRGVHFAPALPIIGLILIICGVILIGYSIIKIINKSKEDSDAESV